MSIAQIRERNVLRLAELHNENPTDADILEAKRLMNSYYRLVGLSESNLYRSNNEWTCNSRYTAEQEDRELRWYKRLSEEFTDFCGAKLRYYSYFPTIIGNDDRNLGLACFYN
jgi:hypothetical protein